MEHHKGLGLERDSTGRINSTNAFVFEDVTKVPVVVCGSGSFGTAMATVIARNGFPVTVLCRSVDVAASINAKHRNPKYLTDFELPHNLTATNDPATALSTAAFVVHSVPIQSSREFLESIAQYIPDTAIFVSTSKGLHADTLEMMKDLIPSALKREQPMAFVSGPSFAKELMQSQPTGLVVAASDMELSRKVGSLFSSTYIKVYASTDIIGVEVGGALKNVFAIAAGAFEGMGYGLNGAAMLVTRGCNEMNRLAIAMGANPRTLSGLSGIGDLMLTCFGPLSRNRSVGVRLGKGETIEQVLASMSEVAEGVATAPAAVRLAKKYSVEAPIIEAIAAVIAGEISAREALRGLMQLPTNDGET